MAPGTLIIGAGITGLVLARLLGPGRALIYEKSKGVGGRVATRRVPPGAFDHGAQFYRVRGPLDLDQYWELSGVSKVWLEREGERLKTGEGGMTKLAKALALGLDVKLGQEVQTVQPSEEGWRVRTLTGEESWFRQVVITAPRPQALMLLERSGLKFSAPPAWTPYESAVVGLLRWESAESVLSGLEYESNVSPRIANVSSQTSKGLSSRLDWTVVMTPAWSAAHFDRDEQTLAQNLRAAVLEDLQGRWGREPKLEELTVKKWRYAQPIASNFDGALFAEPAPGLYLAGDAFGGGSILGADRSARGLAERLRAPHRSLCDTIEVFKS